MAAVAEDQIAVPSTPQIKTVAIATTAAIRALLLVNQQHLQQALKYHQEDDARTARRGYIQANRNVRDVEEAYNRY